MLDPSPEWERRLPPRGREPRGGERDPTARVTARHSPLVGSSPTASVARATCHTVGLRREHHARTACGSRRHDGEPRRRRRASRRLLEGAGRSAAAQYERAVARRCAVRVRAPNSGTCGDDLPTSGRPSVRPPYAGKIVAVSPGRRRLGGQAYDAHRSEPPARCCEDVERRARRPGRGYLFGRLARVGDRAASSSNPSSSVKVRAHPARRDACQAWTEDEQQNEESARRLGEAPSPAFASVLHVRGPQQLRRQELDMATTSRRRSGSLGRARDELEPLLWCAVRVSRPRPSRRLRSARRGRRAHAEGPARTRPAGSRRGTDRLACRDLREARGRGCVCAARPDDEDTLAVASPYDVSGGRRRRRDAPDGAASAVRVDDERSRRPGNPRIATMRSGAIRQAEAAEVARRSAWSRSAAPYGQRRAQQERVTRPRAGLAARTGERSIVRFPPADRQGLRHAQIMANSANPARRRLEDRRAPEQGSEPSTPRRVPAVRGPTQDSELPRAGRVTSTRAVRRFLSRNV